MRDIPLTADNSCHLPFGIEGDDPFREIEIHGAAAGAARVENQRQITHLAKTPGESRVTRTGHRIAFDYLIHGRVSHPLDGTDYSGREFRIFDFAVMIEFEKHAHYQAILVRVQGADAAGKLLGQHWHRAIRKIDGSASQTRLAVER